jgi:outer membrane protein TolC
VPGTPPLSIDRSIGTNDRVETGLDLSWPLFTGYSRSGAVAARKEALGAKRAALEAVRRRLSLGLGVLFLQWELSYRQADLRRALVGQLETYERQVRAMREAGTVLQSKLLEANARLEFARVDLAMAEDQNDSLRRELMSFIQSRDHTVFPDTGAAALDALPLPESVDTARPELRALDRTAAQLTETRRAVRGQKFPLLLGIAGYRYAKPGLAMGSDEFMGYAMAGVQLRWNLFDGMKNRAVRVQLSRQIDLLEIERAKQLDALRRSFEQAREQLTNAASRLEATEKAAAAARALAEDMQNQLSAGSVTTADYLNALVGQAQAELTAEQARMSKRVALLRLLYAAGTEISY